MEELRVEGEFSLPSTLAGNVGPLAIATAWVELKKGKEVTELWLARQLRPYGVRPRTMWIGEEIAKGYFREDFDEVFGRCIPRKEAKAMLEEITASAEPPGRGIPGPAVGEGKSE